MPYPDDTPDPAEEADVKEAINEWIATVENFIEFVIQNQVNPTDTSVRKLDKARDMLAKYLYRRSEIE